MADYGTCHADTAATLDPINEFIVRWVRDFKVKATGDLINRKIFIKQKNKRVLHFSPPNKLMQNGKSKSIP